MWRNRSRLFVGLLACLVLLLAGLGWRSFVHEPVPTLVYPSGQDPLAGWTPYGGQWSSADHVIYGRHAAGERGAKLMTGSTSWTDYALSADMRFDGDRGDMGVIIRAQDESVGLDAYNGYYVGLRMDGGSLLIGRSNYGWSEARPVQLPGGVNAGSWLRLRAVAYGCDIAASVENLDTKQMAWIAFRERSCLRSGRIGLRSVDSDGVWQNISISPASRQDYLALQRQAGSVEQPVVLTGPSWWTTWHVVMVFLCVLAAAMLAQFAYFRVERWKSNTIMQERERLAHDIHDTMAQSFAGVGYQIQGIRSSVLRDEKLDARRIAEQLNVAYQLVRRCHAEASSTITMLGLTSPLGERGLLETLAETAGRIAGEEIETSIHLQGDFAPLSLRVSDAMLHIGQEAIANAVSHASPTRLKITLRNEEDAVELIVADDGQGFEVCPHTAGLGIMGMQKRARSVAAVLEISSTRGNGTEVHVRMPRQQGGRFLRWKMRVRQWIDRSNHFS